MHPKLLWFRTKLFRYRLLEREVAMRPNVQRMLDVGCGDGENLQRFADLPLKRTGLEVSRPRLRSARKLGLDVVQASGVELPYSAGSFDLIYVAHVLHHVADYERVLEEIKRCLAPSGRLFLVETVSDNPLLRLGRRVRPSWRGDKVEKDWRYRELAEMLSRAGFVSEAGGRYNVLFFLWEMLPLAFWPLEVFTPIFVYLDLLLARFFGRYSAHCYFLLRDGEAAG